jgi:hypothetical protein
MSERRAGPGPWLVPLCALLSACGSDEVRDSYYGRLVYDVLPETAKGAPLDDFGLTNAFVLQVGFGDERQFEYLDLGSFNPIVPRMYVLEHDGKPVAGQYPIVDTLPDKEDYSPFWQIVRVEVGGGYEANDIKSLKGLEEADFDMTPTLEAVHCPVVNPDATWVTSDLSAVVTVFPGNGEAIANPNFNTDPELGPVDDRPTLEEKDATDGDIVLTPVWHKRLLGFCWTQDFAKRFPLEKQKIDGQDVVVLADAAFAVRFDQYETLPDAETGDPGTPWDTRPIFEALRGQPGYSPARTLLAAQTMTGDQLTSASQIDASAAVAIDAVDNPIVREVPQP